ATACAAGWLAGTAEFALARILPGPRTRDEIVTMVLTSALVPPAAAWHWLYGQARHRTTPAHRHRAVPPSPSAAAPAGERMPT
ncbi:transferase, partial [Actinospica acidiphila]|nr:transferase [Actinospica acidiphila]